MIKNLSRYLLGILAILLTIGSVLTPITPARNAVSAQTSEQGPIPITSDAISPGSNGFTITLISGDVLVVSLQASGSFVAEIRPAPRPDGKTAFQTMTDSKGDKFVIPSDVRSLIPNTLDPLFFDINYLITNHLTDDKTPYLRAIVQYASTSPMHGPWSSFLVRSSDLASIHSQAIVIPKSQAVDFGKILRAPSAAQSLTGIEKIWLDKVFTASDDQSGPLIGATVARNVLGYNGSGIKIAIIDTGIDNTHPDFFFPNGSSKITINADYECYGQAFDSSQCDGTTHDLFGHGTHVAGIAAGTGAASAGKYVGIAPGATLMNVKVLNRYGYGFTSWIIPGMQAAANGINGTKADIISMSLGDGVTDGTDPMSQAVNNLSASTGVLFVIAAGNSGSGEVTVAAPGAATAAITVAASTKVEPVSIAYFSSHGPRAVDFNLKPDITAPGVSIISTCSSTAIYLTCPTSSYYLTLSGTSMATPHVSGSAALLLQAARASGTTLTPAQVKNMLQDSSRILLPQTGQPDVDIYQQGAGLVRIDRAITSNLTFTPAEMSFGLVPYNTTSTLKGTFQVTNRGRTTQTLSLNWTMYDVPSNLSPLSSGSSFTSLVSLDKTSLAIASGGSANVTMTINAAQAPYQKLWTFFSGRITATSTTGEQEHAIFGFTKEGQRQTLNITGIMADGTPAAGQYYSIFDVNDGQGLHTFFNGFNSAGQAIVRVPLSTYAVWMTIIDSSKLQLIRITNFNVVVQNPTTVILDARTAGAVTLNLQADPNATVGLQQDDIFAFASSTYSYAEFDYLINGNWNFVGENPSTAQIGTLWTQDRWQRTRNPSVNSTVLYDLALTRQHLGPVIHTITSSNLTTTTGINKARFHADAPTTMQYARSAIPAKFNPHGYAILIGFYPINVPTIQTQYTEAGESVIHEALLPGTSLFWFDTTYTTPLFGITWLGKTWAAGESTVASWLEQPVHPTLVTASRSGNTLSLTGYEVSDTYGHTLTNIYAKGVNFTLSVYVNNVLTFTSNSFPCATFFPAFPRIPCASPYSIPLPSTSATVKIQMLATLLPSWSRLGSPSNTTITFTTSASGQGPLVNSKYIVGGLNLQNQVAGTPNATKLYFNISLTTPTGALFNATSVAILYSTDNGTTWFKVKTLSVLPGLVTARGVGIPTPGTTTYVSLQVTIQSANGTTFYQKIIRAVQIVQGAAAPPP